jgi:predicted nucleic acid-binding Zn finger protein
MLVSYHIDSEIVRCFFANGKFSYIEIYKSDYSSVLRTVSAMEVKESTLRVIGFFPGRKCVPGYF